MGLILLMIGDETRDERGGTDRHLVKCHNAHKDRIHIRKACNKDYFKNKIQSVSIIYETIRRECPKCLLLDSIRCIQHNIYS